MSFRQDNSLHFRTPYLLMRIPEYMRWFDTQAIGGLYRLLSSKIYRKGVGQLKFYKEGTYVSELAKRYDSGKLCCYLTDEEIQDAMLLKERRVEDIKKQLVDLKLIKSEKFKDGYIYELGVIYFHEDEDGYKTGKESEGHYIDSWYTWASSEENSETLLAFRYYLAEKLGSDKKKDDVQFELGKILPGIEQNFAEILALTPTRKPAPAQKKPAPKTPSIEVNKIETNNYVSPVEDRTFDNEDVKREMVSQFKARLKYGGYLISNLSKDYRAMLAEGVDKTLLSGLILASVHETNRFPELPLFSKNFEVKFKNDVDNVSWKWFALREDITGAMPPVDTKSKMYKEVKIAFKGVLDNYSLDQVLWTIKEIAKNPKTREALVKNHFAISKMMADYSVNYSRYVEAKRISDAKNEAQKAADQVSEDDRRNFLKHVAKSSVVVEKNEEEKTIEYWQNKLENTDKPNIISLCMRKIDEIKRSQL
jgi:hypothetical protein